MAKLNLEKFKSNASSALSKKETQGIFKEHHDTHESVNINELSSAITIRLFETNSDALRHSIEALGQIEPIIVRRVGKKYEVLNGNRRVAIAKALGFADISADIIEVSDNDALFLPYLLNSHEGYDAIEIAQYLKRLQIRHHIDAPTILEKTGLHVDAYEELFCDETGTIIKNFNSEFEILLKKYFKMRDGEFDIEKNGIRLKVGIDSAKADDATQAEVYRFIHKLSNL